jgi:hypothetical protein
LVLLRENKIKTDGGYPSVIELLNMQRKELVRPPFVVGDVWRRQKEMPSARFGLPGLSSYGYYLHFFDVEPPFQTVTGLWLHYTTNFKVIP